MIRRAWPAALALTFVACLGLSPTDRAGPAAAEPKAGKKYALLIGCTKYPNNPQLVELYGPANDVPLMAALLEEQFGFARGDVERLVGWGPDPKTRPTYKNITAAMERLANRAGPGVQIVVQFSGHGTQVPIPDTQLDPLDPKNPEPDGLDEVFLPADVKTWTGTKIPGGLIDDEIGAWLDKVRGKGANVFMVFDCCHSGTMTRGAGDVERSRTAKPLDVGVPPKQLEAAVARAKAAVEKAGASGLEVRALDLDPRKKVPGSYVAFSGAQAFEEAPELPRPAGAPRSREHYYGMLTYTLVQTLRQSQRRLTYRELGQLMAARYRGERGAMAPTPAFEGGSDPTLPPGKGDDLDRDVLGQKIWPRRSDLVVERDGDKLSVTAGELRGLTKGSVLSIHPPPGDPRDAKVVLGYLRITKAMPVRSDVEPCEFKGTKAVAAAKVPDQARCKVAEQDFGDMSLKLAVGKAVPKAEAALVRSALDRMTPHVKKLVQVVPDEARADWVFLTKDGKLELWAGQGRATAGLAKDKGAVTATVKPTAVAEYSLGKAEALAKELDSDLQKVFTLHNLWRVAGKLDSASGDLGLKVELFLPGRPGKASERLVSGGPIRSGQPIEIRIANEGIEKLWVTFVMVSADFSVMTLTRLIEAGGKLPTQKSKIHGDVGGPEGLIVFAVAQSVSPAQPNYDFLAQKRLGGVPVTKVLRDAPRTPFGRLMAGATLGRGSRGLELEAPTNPGVLSWSWTLVPAAKKK